MAISRRRVSPDVDKFLSQVVEGYVSAADAAIATAFARALRGEGDPREAAALAYMLLRESDPARRQNSPRVELQPRPAQRFDR